MPDLNQSLQRRDLGHLKIVADFWEVELNAPDARVGLQRLAPELLGRARVQRVVEALPEAARQALGDLVRNEGRMPWALFTRRFGAVREMGAGRRDREQPFNNEPSIAEMLWYRALAGRDFFPTAQGSEEFAYIPDDLLPLLPPLPASGPEALGRPASPAERAHLLPASDRVLDHATTLLAALRLGLPIEETAAGWKALPAAPDPCALHGLLAAAGLLDAGGLPQLEATRAFLEARRGEALSLLARAWQHSAAFNELHLVPGLLFEGNWSNDPLAARQSILDFLSTVPGFGGEGKRPWWSLAAFVAAVRQAHPDFQRPAGDYDSWYIRDQASDEFLRGFEHWEEVDGGLIRYVLTGPMHWLGILELAAPAPDSAPAAFRFSPWAGRLLSGAAPEGLPVEEAGLVARSDARLHVPRLAPRAARYQAARFGVWEAETEEGYTYRITPASLERARGQGLRVSHLLALLRRQAATVPPPLARALERWEERGSEARFQRLLVLRLSTPDLLAALRSSRAGRFLGDPLGPTTVIVKDGAWEKVMSVLAEMGYLAEVEES